MKTLLLAIITGLIISILTACAEAPAGNIPPIHGTTSTAPKKTLRPFRSEQELKDYLKELAAKQRRAMQATVGTANETAEPVAANKAVAKSAEPAQESVTNVQHAGVDEGGIVSCMANTWWCCGEAACSQ